MTASAGNIDSTREDQAAERIAGCDDTGVAAAILSRVLGATGSGE
jgi:hypothetical protein